MVDIFSIPLFYISFNRSKEIEQHYHDYGFKNVNHFNAVNGKKFDIDKLRQNNVITIRSYDDLKSGRRQHSGMPSLGAIGCTLSHYELWKLCIENNWPFIIIAEQDNRMSRILTNEDVRDITSSITKPTGMFLSTSISQQDHRKHFFGTHFYIASLEACKVLVQNCLPIDVQTDWYISHLGTTNDISIEGYRISHQKGFSTNIQTDNCLICRMPTGKLFYISIILLVVILVVLIFYFMKKLRQCRYS